MNENLTAGDVQIPPLTFGQKACGVTFNPSRSVDVDDVKEKCANLVDYLNNLRSESIQGEKKRMLSLAITDMQTAQMWAVKAITWTD